ncbi:response regulator [Nocardia niigatensis]
MTAVRVAAEVSPDLVPMDLRMPGMDGVEATRQILAGRSAPKILVLTTFDDDKHLCPALAGASGYLIEDIRTGCWRRSGGRWTASCCSARRRCAA